MKRAAILLALWLGACGGFREEPPPATGTATTGGEVPQAAAADLPPPVPVAKPGDELGGTIVVAPGDTLYAIARRHGVSMRGLIELNGLTAPYVLKVGQTLRLPEEYFHRVAAGDTLSEIARHYGVSLRALATANDLADPYIVKVGQRLRLPTAGTIAAAEPDVSFTIEPAVVAVEPVAGTAEPEPVVLTAPEPEPAAATTEVVPTPEPEPVVVAAVPQPEPRAEDLFAWPVQGPILSSFGSKPGGLNNDGINIGASRGTPVVAAENGVVVYAGNEIPGFGNLILIRHADGWATAYAHNDKLLVAKGDSVARGQPIARVGSTGSVSEPQSHFEIRKGNEPVDPLKYLSAR